LLVEEHERVVIRAIAHEVAERIAEVGVLREPRRLREVERVGHVEAEELRVELDALGELVHVESEVAEPPDLERTREGDAADNVTLSDGCHWPSLLADRHSGDRGQPFGEEAKVRAAVERTKDAAVIGAEDGERAVRGQTRRIDVVVEPWQTLTAHELRVAVER